jgi:hypothetical protein
MRALKALGKKALNCFECLMLFFQRTCIDLPSYILVFLLEHRLWQTTDEDSAYLPHPL